MLLPCTSATTLCVCTPATSSGALGKRTLLIGLCDAHAWPCKACFAVVKCQKCGPKHLFSRIRPTCRSAKASIAALAHQTHARRESDSADPGFRETRFAPQETRETCLACLLLVLPRPGRSTLVSHSLAPVIDCALLVVIACMSRFVPFPPWVAAAPPPPLAPLMCLLPSLPKIPLLGVLGSGSMEPPKASPKLVMHVDVSYPSLHQSWRRLAHQVPPSSPPSLSTS